MDIKDKEYLAFCNATNLDWQFVELKNKMTGKQKPNIFLKDLLTPASFVKRNEKGEITGYIYGAKGNSYNEVEGLNQMRSVAGVAMNYLEECGKNSKEGDFLKDWEAGRAIKN